MAFSYRAKTKAGLVHHEARKEGADFGKNEQNGERDNLYEEKGQHAGKHLSKSAIGNGAFDDKADQPYRRSNLAQVRPVSKSECLNSFPFIRLVTSAMTKAPAVPTPTAYVGVVKPK